MIADTALAVHDAVIAGRLFLPGLPRAAPCASRFAGGSVFRDRILLLAPSCAACVGLPNEGRLFFCSVDYQLRLCADKQDADVRCCGGRARASHVGGALGASRRLSQPAWLHDTLPVGASSGIEFSGIELSAIELLGAPNLRKPAMTDGRLCAMPVQGFPHYPGPARQGGALGGPFVDVVAALALRRTTR